MSYVVKVNARVRWPRWLNNAFDHILGDKPFAPTTPDTLAAWKKAYNNTITLEQPDCIWALTFPSEQDYVMFLLRWS